MDSAYLGLGTNLGDPQQQLSAAVDALARRGISVAAISSVYCTEPHGDAGQPWFHNACVVVHTDVDPVALLEACLAIEHDAGRLRSAPNAPRPIDIDLLAMGDLVMDTGLLILPHPRMHLRRFVLEPLAEIAPDWIHPVQHKSVRRMLSEVRDTGIVRPAGFSI